MATLVNEVAVLPLEFDSWAYPATFEPRRVSITLPSADGPVHVEILGGLMPTASPLGEYGVYVYCNRRLVGRSLKTFDVGFVPGNGGKPHPSRALMRVAVSFSGPSSGMPWNSSKSDLNTQHWAFRSIQPNLVKTVTYWSTLSRRLQGEWTTKVRPFVNGSMREETEEAGKPTRSYLPKLPSARPPSFAERTSRANAALQTTKPWVAGLIDGLIAVSVIRKERRIHQRNRIALILLDSTLEIAFKDYLVNEIDPPISERQLVGLTRSDLQSRVAQRVTLPDDMWQRIDHFYFLRCKLVHERAHAGLDDREIDNHVEAVATFLRAAFGVMIDTSAL